MLTRLRPEGTEEPQELSSRLGLELTTVTDQGLAELKGLQNLTFLDLHGTKVTDVGVKEVKDLDRLTSLNLTDTKVTDAVA